MVSLVVMVVTDIKDMDTADMGISVTDTDIMADNVLFTAVEK
jgi:hypothetical protein